MEEAFPQMQAAGPFVFDLEVGRIGAIQSFYPSSTF